MQNLKEDVIARLASLGYTFNADTDKWLIVFLSKKIASEIKNDLNTSEVPPELYEVMIDMIAGEFFLARKVSGGLGDLNVAEAIKSLKEGDTTITYADSSLTTLIDILMNRGKAQFAAFRRLRW